MASLPVIAMTLGLIVCLVGCALPDRFDRYELLAIGLILFGVGAGTTIFLLSRP